MEIVSANVALIASGSKHSLLLNKDGSLWGMGSNSIGQLGVQAGEDLSVPTLIQEDHSVTFALVSGEGDTDNTSFRLDGNQLLTAESLDSSSQDSYQIRVKGTAPDGETLESSFTIVVQDEPENTSTLQLSLDNNTVPENQAAGRIVGQLTLEGSPGIVDISAGDHHSFYIKSDGSLWAMGENFSGQLGDGTNLDKHSPVRILGANAEHISGGSEHSLITKQDGSVWAMGNNEYGQLGIGHEFDEESPTSISTLQDAHQISAGNSHSLFVTTDGSLWATGDNEFGQLGNGNFNGSSIPVQILSSGVTQASAGGVHSLIIQTGGSLWAMGFNGFGQLGDATDEDKTTPVKIMETEVRKVAAGGLHSLILKEDGSLWAMGNNEDGQLGDGTFQDQSTPIRIVESEVMDIAAGGHHSLYIKEDGSLWAMGNNEAGQIGDNTLQNQPEPVKVVESGVTQIAAGAEHSLFLKEDGSLWAMGENESGQFGEGSTLDNAAPILVTTGDSFTFIFIDGNGDDHNDLFAINGDTLSTTESFDYETQDTYSLRVKGFNQDGESTEAILEIQITNLPEGQDFRYISTPLEHGWERQSWFGLYYPAPTSDWLYHEHLGWLYLPSPQPISSLWLWHPNQGWLWTSNNTYPWLYSHNLESWLYFDAQLQEKRLYVYNDNQWIEE